MIDDEVMRLRRLRNTALRAREIAAMLDSNAADRSSVLSQSAVSCWRIARVITGRLREHPYPSYQRGPSTVRCVYRGISAAMVVFMIPQVLWLNSKLRRVESEAAPP